MERLVQTKLISKLLFGELNFGHVGFGILVMWFDQFCVVMAGLLM